MNDPNGPIWYKGYYHMFYQHNPTADTWGNLHWGHAKSKDLVNWEHLPPALAPDKSANEQHCFSGCLVLDGEVPTILYSSVEFGKNQRQWATIRLARSYDDMLTWQREKMPVLTQDIHKERVGEWRDPFIWKENDEWNMVVGGEQEGYGRIFRYVSKNLLNWEYTGVFFEDKSAPFLECPNVLRFRKKSVLLYSPHGEVVYCIGEIQNGVFVSETQGILDNSGRKGFYAPNTLLNDPKGRYITWGWITEEARNGLRVKGYSGALSIPRVLTLTKENKLCVDTVEEYEMLREESETLQKQALNGKVELDLRGKSWEISLQTECDVQDDFSIVLLESTDGREKTKIHFCAQEKTLTLERALTSINNEPDKTFQRVTLDEEKKLDLHIFLDESIVEIFANHQFAITGRLYPELGQTKNVYLEGKAKSITLQSWVLKPAEFTRK